MHNSELRSENIVVVKTFQFALQVIDLHAKLKELKHYEIGSQVLRSGTSIGANVREAQRAESRKDFIHKLSIALKEADETQYWFSLISAKLVPVEEMLKTDLEEIINTTKKNNSEL